MEARTPQLHRTFLGEKRPIRFPYFFVKLFLLGFSTTYFFIEASPYKLMFLIAVIVANAFVLRKTALRILRFLLVTTLLLVTVWFFFVFFPQYQSVAVSFNAMINAKSFRNAVIRLWGLFAVGQLFLGITSQYEVLLSLHRIHANINISLFFVVLFNAVSYLICSFHEIEHSFYCRVARKPKLADKIPILYSVVFDAIKLIFECKKAFYLNKDRVVYSLLGHSTTMPRDKENNSLPFIQIQQVKYPEQTKPIIIDASFLIQDGITVITGKNGSGKTTLFNILSGVIPNIINAEYETGKSCIDLHSLNIGHVLQGVEIAFFYDTVERALGHLPRNRVEGWLKAFQMSYLLDGERAISELSAGECKVIALLAELLDPCHSVCLLDEPTAFLSARSQHALICLLHEACVSKKIVLISHDSKLIQIADRVLLLNDGYLMETTAYNIRRGFAPDYIVENRHDAICVVSVPQPLPPKHFLKHHIVQQIQNAKDIIIYRGENLAICGENGAGKSTLGVYLQNTIAKSKEGLRCVMMKQAINTQFFTSTIIDELLLGTDKSATTREKAMSYLRFFELDVLANQPAQFISGGEKRLILLLCLLMQQPQVVILDEPFDSIDEKNKARIIEFIESYRDDSQCSFIFIDQSIEEFHGIVDRCFVIDNFCIKPERNSL